MIIKGKTTLNKVNSDRSFITMPVPYDLARKIKNYLLIFSSENRNLNYVDVDQMHITLQFLGEAVSKESLNLISTRLMPILKQIQSPTISTGELRFGHKSQMIPNVLFLEILPSEELQEITRQIHYTITSLRLSDIRRQKDYKKLIYHITLGRAKHHISRSFGRKMNGYINSSEAPIFSFNPTHVSILTSRYTIKGHKYSEYSSLYFIKI